MGVHEQGSGYIYYHYANYLKHRQSKINDIPSLQKNNLNPKIPKNLQLLEDFTNAYIEGRLSNKKLSQGIKDSLNKLVEATSNETQKTFLKYINPQEISARLPLSQEVTTVANLKSLNENNIKDLFAESGEIYKALIKIIDASAESANTDDFRLITLADVDAANALYEAIKNIKVGSDLKNIQDLTKKTFKRIFENKSIVSSLAGLMLEDFYPAVVSAIRKEKNKVIVQGSTKVQNTLKSMKAGRVGDKVGFDIIDTTSGNFLSKMTYVSKQYQIGNQTFYYRTTGNSSGGDKRQGKTDVVLTFGTKENQDIYYTSMKNYRSSANRVSLQDGVMLKYLQNYPLFLEHFANLFAYRESTAKKGAKRFNPGDYYNKGLDALRLSAYQTMRLIALQSAMEGNSLLINNGNKSTVIEPSKYLFVKIGNKLKIYSTDYLLSRAFNNNYYVKINIENEEIYQRTAAQSSKKLTEIMKRLLISKFIPAQDGGLSYHEGLNRTSRTYQQMNGIKMSVAVTSAIFKGL